MSVVMKKTFEMPQLDKIEFTVAARLESSNDGILHDSGNHTACTYTTNSHSAGYANMCRHTNGRNSAGGSGIGSCR
jgi:hypothetical protein